MSGHSYETGYDANVVTLSVNNIGAADTGSKGRQKLVQAALRAARAVSDELYGKRDAVQCMLKIMDAMDTTKYSSGTDVIDAVLDADTAKWFKAYRVTPAIEALLPKGVQAGRCKAAVNALYKVKGGTVAGSKTVSIVQQGNDYSVDVVDLCVELYDRGLSTTEIQQMLEHYGHKLSDWELLELLNRECGYLDKFIHIGNGEMLNVAAEGLETLDEWKDVVVEHEQRKWRGM